MRHLDGYCEVSFPHCPCDSRKEGHVIAIVGRSCFKLQACKADGAVEVRMSRGDKYSDAVYHIYLVIRQSFLPSKTTPKI